MLSQSTILQSTKFQSNRPDHSQLQLAIKERLVLDGYCLIRGFKTDMAWFSDLISTLCQSVTFDPARQTNSEKVQKVDAGTDEIGLHIENGNTPNIPQIVSFFSRKAARQGSRTTLCDGVSLWTAMDSCTKELFDQPLLVSRNLPEALWKAYLCNEHPLLENPVDVQEVHLQQMLEAMPGHKATIRDDGSLDYSMSIDPVRVSALSGLNAFANAILGPSFNYEPPVYRLQNGDKLNEAQIESIRVLAKQCTIEVPWQNGDIVLLDNWRVMHGRRRIEDTGHRELFIGMGNL